MKKTLPKKIFIASDHAGFLLKEFLIEELSKLDMSVSDLGSIPQKNPLITQITQKN